MTVSDVVLFEGDTALEHYRVVDTVYDGRQARVLYSGEARAAQSGIARDDRPDMLFDYNQRFLELATGLRPKRVLVIGGGCYTLPLALLEALPLAQIDVVERDSDLDELAERFFDLKPDKRLCIVHSDGRKYVDSCQKIYDMIIIDAFVQMTIPKNLTDKEAAVQLERILIPEGVVAVNVISPYHGPKAVTIKQYQNNYQSVFKRIEIFPADGSLPLWQSQNFILTARQYELSVPYMRFPAVSNQA